MDEATYRVEERILEVGTLFEEISLERRFWRGRVAGFG